MRRNVVRLRYYRNYRFIGKTTREQIQRELGRSDGTMRQRAREHDPACVVAFKQCRAVGWATFYRRPIARSAGNPAIMVYVAKEQRRQGIGTELIDRLNVRAKISRYEPFTYWTPTKAVERFYREAGVVHGKRKEKSFTQ